MTPHRECAEDESGPAPTGAAESGSISFHLTGIMSGIHFDPDGGHGNGLKDRRRMGVRRSEAAKPHPWRSGTHLVSKQNHDGVAPSSRRGVLHREGVVVVPDDVKIDVGLCGSDHSRSALDSNADVT